MHTSLEFNPPVIAHRGASAYAPENTMAAFTKAVQLGARWIEFDVEQAACGEPMIMHDEYLDRTTDGKGLINKYSYDFLRSLDAGAWFDYRFSGEKIPSLRQVIDFLFNTQISANVEIKPLPGQDEALVKRVLNEIEKSCLATAEYRGTILYSSFSFESLRFLRKYSPSCLMGMLLHGWLPGWEDLCTELRCVSVHVNQEIMTMEAAQKIKQMGKALLCYTVNDPARALELFSWGVDAVFSDVPDIIMVGAAQT